MRGVEEGWAILLPRSSSLTLFTIRLAPPLLQDFRWKMFLQWDHRGRTWQLGDAQESFTNASDVS